MLKLELTDGHTTVIAMEYCPIKCLSTKLYPGTKILIKGELLFNLWMISKKCNNCFALPQVRCAA